MSIERDLILFAIDENPDSALKAGVSLQDALETMAKIGSPDEVIAASFLLNNVNQGIGKILRGFSKN